MTEAIRTWRLLDGAPRPAAWQTACSAALLRARAEGGSPDTFRFLSFQHPCVLLGAYQIAPAADGTDLQRRITGGPAVFAGPTEVAWELVVGRRESPEAVQATAAALRNLGFPADPGPDCLLLNRRAVCWFVETSERQAALFQGLISVRPPDPPSPHVSAAISLHEAGGGEAPAPEALRAAIADAFRDRFAVSLEPGDPTPQERAFVAEAIPAFRSEEWVRSVRVPEGTVTEATTVGKGAAVRAFVAHGGERNRIERVVFSGEFCARPREAVGGLERELAGTSIDEAPARIENYFVRTGAEIAGLSPGDFFTALSLAFMKRRVAQSAAPDPQAWKKELRT